MLNYFNFKPFRDKILVTNDFGNYDFLSPEDFALFVRDSLPNTHPSYGELEEKLFLYEGEIELFLRKAQEAAKYGKRYLYSGTSLFIFAVTGWCNAKCVYCQARDGSRASCGQMTAEMADKALDISFSTPAHSINIEFQGGEPLGNFEVIQHIVVKAEARAEVCGKEIMFSLVSNLSLLTNEMLNFIKTHNIHLSTSLDGGKKLHDLNRPMRDGRSAFDLLQQRVRMVREAGVVLGAIQTTTKATLSNSQTLIDTYLALGMTSIFIRPLTPLGAANEGWNEIGYLPEEFVGFYRECLQYLLQVNRNGRYISEGHARIFLSKIFYGDAVNYMELRSPCGASIGQMAFYHDGNVYTCDEGRMLAEMGDQSFKIGTLDNTYDELIDSPVCKTACAASVLECLPECCDCVYQPYCGVCPVINYALSGDVFAKAPRNFRCQLYQGMLDVIFEILQNGNGQDIEIFKSWVRRDCE